MLLRCARENSAKMWCTCKVVVLHLNLFFVLFYLFGLFVCSYRYCCCHCHRCLSLLMKLGDTFPNLCTAAPFHTYFIYLGNIAWDACDQRKNVGSDVTHANYSCGCQAKMATRKQLHSSHSFDAECCEGGRELFEACRNGDVTKVRRIVNINPNVNIRDTAGRKSSPLHFAAGKNRMKTNRMSVAR